MIRERFSHRRSASALIAAQGAALPDVPPPPLAFRRAEYTIVDVKGSWTRELRGTLYFPQTVNRLPTAPLLVTMRLERRQADPYAVAAYVYGRQVGWLGSDWRRRDRFVRWMSSLEEARILPRFRAAIRLRERTGERVIAVRIPARFRRLRDV